MIIEIIEGFKNTFPLMFWTSVALFLFVIMEIYAILFFRTECTRRKNEVEWPEIILVKIFSLMGAIVTLAGIFLLFQVITFVALNIEEVLEALLIFLSIVGGLIIILYLNKYLYLTFSKKAEYKGLFKKGDILVVDEDSCNLYGDGNSVRSAVEDRKKICDSYAYEFRGRNDKDGGFDGIYVKSLDFRSSWKDELRTFPESYFKLADKETQKQYKSSTPKKKPGRPKKNK